MLYTICEIYNLIISLSKKFDSFYIFNRRNYLLILLQIIS